MELMVCEGGFKGTR